MNMILNQTTFLTACSNTYSIKNSDNFFITQVNDIFTVDSRQAITII